MASGTQAPSSSLLCHPLYVASIPIVAKCSPSSHHSYNIFQVGRRRKVTSKGKSEHVCPGSSPQQNSALSHWPEICHVITEAAREHGTLSKFKSHIVIWMEMETCE